MIKYFVDDIKGHRIYEGFDEDYAYKICRQYNDACGGTYEVDELDTDLDEFEEVTDNHYIFPQNDYLTSIYGDDENIKKDMKIAIEYQTGKEIIDFELVYNDPGDTGDRATFQAQRIQWKEGR